MRLNNETQAVEQGILLTYLDADKTGGVLRTILEDMERELESLNPPEQGID